MIASWCPNSLSTEMKSLSGSHSKWGTERRQFIKLAIQPFGVYQIGDV